MTVKVEINEIGETVQYNELGHKHTDIMFTYRNNKYTASIREGINNGFKFVQCITHDETGSELKSIAIAEIEYEVLKAYEDNKKPQHTYNPRAERLLEIQTKYIPIVGDFLNETANKASWYSIGLRITNENMIEINAHAYDEGTGCSISRTVETVRDFGYAKYAAKVLIATLNLIDEACCTLNVEIND